MIVIQLPPYKKILMVKKLKSQNQTKKQDLAHQQEDALVRNNFPFISVMRVMDFFVRFATHK